MIPLDPWWDIGTPFVLIHTEFSVRLSFVMTIDKTPEQIFKIVGICVTSKKTIFSHGQFCVALLSYICWEATDAITEPSDRVYICLRDFKLPPSIENPTDYEVRALIRFLCAQGFKSVDIHHQISEVYGENIMSDGMVRKWVRTFKDGRTNIHDEERSGRPSVSLPMN
ncbi:HTH_48 domain-containing protein [Trichonephila clavipes]|nr:HTH_48 domain-containing protein [Trichonephila clavipes]